MNIEQIAELFLKEIGKHIKGHTWWHTGEHDEDFDDGCSYILESEDEHTGIEASFFDGHTEICVHWRYSKEDVENNRECDERTCTFQYVSIDFKEVAKFINESDKLIRDQMAIATKTIC